MEDGTVAAGIDCTNKALWVFFDREAISELQKSIIGKMIGNPIEIATLAYTDKVKQTKLDGDKAEQFGTQAKVPFEASIYTWS